MTGGIRFRYGARTMAEAVDIALDRWRQWVDDPSAELPWSTHYDVQEVEAELMVECRIDFDRAMLEKGVASSE